MNDSIFSHVRDNKSNFTVGGMKSKLEAIKGCTASGIPVILAAGKTPDLMRRITKDRDLGTYFMPQKGSR